MPLPIDIANADKQSITAALTQIKSNYLPNYDWILPNNRYRKDTINYLEIDEFHNRVNHKYLREYIASSAILFCSDGWINFSRSIECLLSGDLANAIHTAYYAEIKAIMSILASEGIGVFNSTHYFVDRTSRTNKISLNRPAGTHRFIPDAILEWSKQAKSKSLFDNLKYNNKSLSEWFSKSPYSSSSAPSIIVEDWIKKYSIDLTYISQDHILRNEMSYRPQEYSFNFNDKIFPHILSFVKELWNLCEPDGVNSLSVLDRHLLRLAIEKLYTLQTGKKTFSGATYEKFIEDIFTNLQISAQSGLYQFMIRAQEKNDLIIFNYAKISPYTLKNINFNNKPKLHYYRKNQFYELNDALAIISRTIILLRFSLSTSSQLLKNSSIVTNDVGFWLDNIGDRYGIDSNISKIVDLADLWSNVKDSIDHIDLINSKNTASTLSEAYLNSISAEFNILTQFQRVFFWGLTN